MTLRVLVLEDMSSRIDWLKRKVGSGAEVIWCRDVPSFMDKAKEDHDTVIFDHDLEIAPLGYSEPRPLTGLDAALNYTPPKKMYSIVWSVNKDGSKAITQVLVKKCPVVFRIPFELRRKDELERAVMESIAYASRKGT
jgi:hypothetical protein